MTTPEVAQARRRRRWPWLLATLAALYAAYLIRGVLDRLPREPRWLVVNQEDGPIDDLVIETPESRLIFGPIPESGRVAIQLKPQPSGTYLLECTNHVGSYSGSELLRIQAIAREARQDVILRIESFTRHVELETR